MTNVGYLINRKKKLVFFFLLSIDHFDPVYFERNQEKVNNQYHEMSEQIHRFIILKIMPIKTYNN
jgi:hypothetical protein